jgi:hypothetical protein
MGDLSNLVLESALTYDGSVVGLRFSADAVIFDLDVTKLKGFNLGLLHTIKRLPLVPYKDKLITQDEIDHKLLVKDFSDNSSLCKAVVARLPDILKASILTVSPSSVKNPRSNSTLSISPADLASVQKSLKDELSIDITGGFKTMVGYDFPRSLFNFTAAFLSREVGETDSETVNKTYHILDFKTGTISGAIDILHDYCNVCKGLPNFESTISDDVIDVLVLTGEVSKKKLFSLRRDGKLLVGVKMKDFDHIDVSVVAFQDTYTPVKITVINTLLGSTLLENVRTVESITTSMIRYNTDSYMDLNGNKDSNMEQYKTYFELVLGGVRYTLAEMHTGYKHILNMDGSLAFDRRVSNIMDLNILAKEAKDFVGLQIGRSVIPLPSDSRGYSYPLPWGTGYDDERDNQYFGKWYICDKNFKPVISEPFDMISGFHKNRMIVDRGGKVAMLDENLNNLTGFIYDHIDNSIRDFGLTVYQGDKIGVIDLMGVVRIPCVQLRQRKIKYRELKSSSGVLVKKEVRGLYGNTLPTEFEMSELEQGVLVICEGKLKPTKETKDHPMHYFEKYGLKNAVTGEFLVEPKYGYLSIFRGHVTAKQALDGSPDLNFDLTVDPVSGIAKMIDCPEK